VKNFKICHISRAQRKTAVTHFFLNVREEGKKQYCNMLRVVDVILHTKSTEMLKK